MGSNGGEYLEKLTIVIPAWSGTDELVEMTSKLVKTVRPMCDEIIVCEDGGIYSGQIEDLVDKYLYHRWNIGDLRNSVLGMWMASGDFIGIVNSDVTIDRGSLRDLCVPGHVCSPQWTQNRERRWLTDFCFVVDVNVLRDRKFGYFDTTADMGPAWDWFGRVAEVAVLKDTVAVSHRGGTSYSAKRQSREGPVDPRLKEISDDRHRIRLGEDPEYRKRWELSQ